MNASFTRKPSPLEEHAAMFVSPKAKALVSEFEGEVSDGREWSNRSNMHNTRVALLAYISMLENQN